MLKASERIDDLLTHDLRIIQCEEVFSFSLDAVLLARFCTVPPRGRIMDLCTGNGVIPLLLTTRTRATITGIEIQERLFDMAERNVKLNKLRDQVTFIHGDLRTESTIYEQAPYDLVTVNPPYLPVGQGSTNENEHIAMARHEIGCTLQDVVRASAKLLKTGGRVAMVHRSSRLAEVIDELRAYRLEPKRIRFVHPREGAESNMVLIEAHKDGKADMRVLPPLIVFRNERDYCDELMEVFYGKRPELLSAEGEE